MMEFGLVALWLVAVFAIGLVSLPLAAVIFRDLSDQGAAFAIPLGLAFLGLVGYIVGHITFGILPLAAGLLALVVVAHIAAGKVEIDMRRFLVPAAVFSAAFLLIIAIRGADPAIAPLGGEKFLDFGLLKSVLRAQALPPEDFWFAGETIQYYYGGQLIAALLTVLTGIPPGIAYNLALATFFGAFVVAGYGVAGNIAAARDLDRRTAGLLGAFFVAIASNLHTALKLLLWLLPTEQSRWIVSQPGFEAEMATWTPGNFHYWNATRIIPGGINEFPFFAWLNGDLHAHMMSPPFLLLVVGVCLAYWLTPETDRRRRQALLVGVVPPIAGLLTVVNTWSFPSAVALVGLTVLFAPADPRTLLPTAWQRNGDAESTGLWRALRAHLRRIAYTIPVGASVLLVGVVWSLPFLLTVASSQPVDIYLRDSPLGPLLLVHGGFLLGFVPFLAMHTDGAFPRRKLVGAAIAVSSVLLVVAGFPNLALFAPILAVSWVLLAGEQDVHMETVLILAGAGLVLLVEFINIDSTPNFTESVGTWNTLFKAYAQVWALWAPAAGVVFTQLLSSRYRLSPPTLSFPDWWPSAGTTLTILVILSTSLYAGFALSNHFEDGVGSLDGTAYVEERHPEEAAAIEWLDGLEGQPNIVTVPACGCNDVDRYSWASAPSSFTGVPTVAGWGGPGGHEYIYRSQEVFDERAADVETIFTGSADAQRQLLDEYDVEYVYVGPLERETYSEITVQDLDAVTVEKQWEHVTIYRVDQQAIGG